jgi:hypothetical protein
MSKITGDRAGATEADDRYGWSESFVPMLARVTRKWPAREGLTFGLYGQWGSGKSTILNLLERYLAERPEEYPHTYIVRFNPWFYDNSKTLVISFFATMGERLKTLGKGEKWAEAGDLLKKVGKFLSVASKGVSVVGIRIDSEAFQEAADTISGAGELAEMADSGERPLHVAREKLVERLMNLGEAGGRVMVLIDDVDRLDSNELFSLLRLLRTVADLPSITLLVAMDEHRVREVLDQAGKYGYGRAYLEKIVQAHVHVPLPVEDVMEGELRSGIVEILTEVGAEVPEEITAPLGQLISLQEVRVLNRIIRTPRDLGRYLNGLRLLTLTREQWDLDAEDATYLAALQVFYPDVYNRVRQSASFLTRSSIHEHLFGSADEEAQLKRRRKRLNWIITGDENSETSREYRDVADLLSQMFGNLESRQYRSLGDETAERKIASFAVFSAYFAFDVEHAWLTRSDVVQTVQSLVDDASGTDQEGFKEKLAELARDPRWKNESVLPTDLRVTFSRLPREQLIDFAQASISVSGTIDPEVWDLFWRALLSALDTHMRRGPTSEAVQALATPVRQWINQSTDLKEAVERLEQAEASFPHNTAAINSFGDTWLTNWERYLASGHDPLEDYTPGWAVKLFITAARWERDLSRDVGSHTYLHEGILEHPERLPVIFLKVKEMASSRPRDLLENLVGGDLALSELIQAAIDAEVADQDGLIEELRK